MVNLTGGYGAGLKDTVEKYDRPFPDRFYTFTEPSYALFLKPDYPKLQAEAIAQAHKDGARGLKILKTLGLYLRENITSGKLVKIDDPRFDPMWDACGQLNMPVAIHVSDPVAFFTPTDRFNERYEELNNHPDWSFYGHDFPEQCGVARGAKPRHCAASEDAVYRASCGQLRGEPGQCLGESGPLRQHDTWTSRRALANWDASHGHRGLSSRSIRTESCLGPMPFRMATQFPQQVFNDKLYEIYYRFLETDDEYFDYAPAKTPPQGRWQIYGINLPESILRKVYNGNAARELHVTV